MDVRIQKLIAESGYCSRRKAEELIAAGRVKINGRPCGLGDKADKVKDLISIDGENLYIEKKRNLVYIMLNKPRGYVTTMSDEMGRKCVTDLLVGVEERVFPVGRLDRNSEGLLLFTNDGDFANQIMHPSCHVSKTYRCTVNSSVTEDQILEMTNGVMLDGKMTLPAVINVVTQEPERTVLLITIKEGRNRQVRRMCEAVGLEVIRLKRNSIGPLKLGMLKPGAYRELTSSELSALRASIQKNTSGDKNAKNSKKRRR